MRSFLLLSAIIGVLIDFSLEQNQGNSSDLIPDYFGVKVQNKEAKETSINLRLNNPFWIRYAQSYSVNIGNRRAVVVLNDLSGLLTLNKWMDK